MKAFSISLCILSIFLGGCREKSPETTDANAMSDEEFMQSLLDEPTNPSHVYELQFTPDSAIVGFIREDTELSREIGFPPPIAERRWYFCWQPVDGKKPLQSVEIDAAGEEYGTYVNLPIAFSFSPDSKYAAVLTVYNFSLVDIDSAEVFRISHAREVVTSFQWLPANQIGYAVNIGTQSTLWKQSLRSGPKTRTKICDCGGNEMLSSEHRGLGGLQPWSPKGSYFIFIDNMGNSDSQLRVLDVTCGEIVASLKQGDLCELQTAWTEDESKVFCATLVVASSAKAYLIKLPSGQFVECSAKMMDAFQGRTPRLLPLWTSDKEYVLANAYTTVGGCLIRPEPWEVIPIETGLKNHMPVDGHYKPSVFRLDRGGWVGVNAMSSSGSWFAAPKYAVDYEVKNVIPLFEEPAVIALSPDGNHVAVCRDNKTVAIHEVSIPSAVGSPQQ